MPSLERYDRLLEEYYLAFNVYRDTISLAIDRAEIVRALQPAETSYERFVRDISRFWWNASILNGIYQPGYLSVTALQVAAGFRSNEVDVPSDAKYTDYLLELAGDPGESVQINRKYLFEGTNNSKDLGKAKQEYLWKAIASHFRRTHELRLHLPDARSNAGRYVQYPKTHMLFREDELETFAKAYLAKNGLSAVLNADAVIADATQSWPAYRRYFPATAQRRIEKEDASCKLELYLAQARRYLSRLTEAHLEGLLDRPDADLASINSQIRQLRAARQGFQAYFLEPDWGDGYDLFRDAQPITQVAAEHLPALLDELGGTMLFCDHSDVGGIYTYLGPKPRAQEAGAPIVELSRDPSTAATAQFRRFVDYVAYAAARGSTVTAPVTQPKPRAKLTGGLRLGREAFYLQGLGPRFVLPEDAPLDVRAQFDASAEYTPGRGRHGMWKATVGEQITRFSIGAPRAHVVPPPSLAFDLATFAYSRNHEPSQANFYSTPRPRHIDVLRGLPTTAIPEAEEAPSLVNPGALRELEPSSPNLVEELVLESDLGELSLPARRSVQLKYYYPIHNSNWEGNAEGAIGQMGDMLRLCYPDADGGLARRLYGALAQPHPLVAADEAQVIALAATTGSAATYVSTTVSTGADLPDLHSNIVRHAIRSALRDSGRANRFVFLVVDLSQSQEACLNLERIMQMYGLCTDRGSAGVHALPDNLYVAFLLSASNRAALRAIPRPHCPLYFINGGWGVPLEGSLQAYRPDRYIKRPERLASATGYTTV